MVVWIYILRTITTAGQCLLNIPAQAANSLYNATQYPGQCYSLDQQCQLIFGLNSRYCNGVSKIHKISIKSLYFFKSLDL